MSPENLTEIVSRLSPDEKAAVREFIEFIKRRKNDSEPNPFQAAIEEFMSVHPELLRLLTGFPGT